MSLKTEYNIENWIKAIGSAPGSYTLNSLMIEAIDIIHLPEIHNAFFERIHYLQRGSLSLKEFSSLDRVMFQIEKELSKVEPIRHHVTFEQVRNLLGADKFVALWLDDKGIANYRIGSMKASEISYLEKLLSVIASKEISKNTLSESI